jgi:acyl carrier protein
MGEPIVVKWDEKSILMHLKHIAVEQLNMTPEQIGAIKLGSKIVDSLQLDSLAQVVLMTAIEHDFGCTLDAEQLQHVDTLRDLVALIERCVAEQRP